MDDPERDEQDAVEEDDDDLELDADDAEDVVGGGGTPVRRTDPPALAGEREVG
jgi:hypothetical protein